MVEKKRLLDNDECVEIDSGAIKHPEESEPKRKRERKNKAPIGDPVQDIEEFLKDKPSHNRPP